MAMLASLNGRMRRVDLMRWWMRKKRRSCIATKDFLSRWLADKKARKRIVNFNEMNRGVLMGRPRKYATDADRVRAHQERNNLVPVTFSIPPDVLEQFNEYLKFKDVTKSDVLTKLIKSQLLRKR